MLEKEFIPYEQALELKELGFDEPCFGYYNELGNFISELDKRNSSCNKPSMYGKYCTAPTFAQAFRWFREKYGYVGYVKTSFIIKNGARHEAFDAYEFIVEHHTEFEFVGTKFKSYEEAETACLNKLIEIVKQKQ
jgi:hypothetical protein